MAELANMSKSPDQIVADIDRKQNEEDRDLPRRAGEAVVKGAKAAKDFVVDTAKDNFVTKTVRAMKDRYDASQMPVEKKAKGGTIKSSASKRADGCAIKGKTRGRMV
jgi:hypothetical protein